MKKFFIYCLICLIIPTCVCANDKVEVTLKKCVDGDTAWFTNKNEDIKVRFLAIDTPESTNKIEAYGKEASNFTCQALKNASKIEIEFDDNSDIKDKYNRYLAWVFVDNTLIQEQIIRNGLGEVKYIYGDYKYLDSLKRAEENAKLNKLGIWNNTNETNYLYIIIITIIIVATYLFNKKSRKKINRKIKKEIKKKIQKL